jgi:hypothetical protein
MAERSSQQGQKAREELRQVVGFRVADEIEKLDRFKKSGAITDRDAAAHQAAFVKAFAFWLAVVPCRQNGAAAARSR